MTKGKKNVGYMSISASYVSSVFQDFESYHRTEVDLVEDDIKMVLDEYNSSFITYELEPGFYTFKDLSEFVFNNLQPKNKASSNVIVIEFDDITMKTKLVVRDDITATRFDKKLFFSTILVFNYGWDYKSFNKNFSQKIINLSSNNKIHLKCDVIDGSVVNGLRQRIL